MKNRIFIITMAPVRLPYDDAAKNLAIELATKIKDKHFILITTKGGIKQKNNMKFVYTPFGMKNKSNMNIGQKIFIFLNVILRTRDTDIFHLITTPERVSSKLLRFFFKLFKKKSIQTVTSIHTLEMTAGSRNIKKLFFADRVITHSDYSKNKLIKQNIPNVKRIYPGVDVKRFDPAKVKKKKRNYPVIVYPGRYSVLESSFGIERFCLMIKEVFSEIKDAKIIMACRIRSKDDKKLEAKIKKSAEECGIKGRMAFFDTVENMPLLFNNCNIGIFPAVKPAPGILEVPLAMIELMAMEKPIIFGNIKPLDEMMKSNIGVMLKADESYSKAIIGLLKKPATMKIMGKNARRAAMKFFNSENAVKQYNQAYNELGET